LCADLQKFQFYRPQEGANPAKTLLAFQEILFNRRESENKKVFAAEMSLRIKGS